MANKTIHELPLTTSVAVDDEVALWETASGILKRIAVPNLVGGVMTGGGVLATGGYTLTVPATGTAALLGVAQTFIAAKTFSVPPIVPGQIQTTGTAVVADDNVYSFTPPGDFSTLIVWTPTGIDQAALIVCRTSTNGNNCGIIAQPSSTFVATTGVLTGTTGTDGKINVSTHSDKKVYIENRMGGNRTFVWMLFSSVN